jgi:hypothetical protein
MLSVIFVVTTLAGINNQAGPVSGSRDDGRDAHALLAKMKTSRDLLKSGTYRASGRLLTNRRSLGAQQPQSEVQIFSAFDLDKGLFRFDRTQDVIRQIGADSVRVYRSASTSAHPSWPLRGLILGSTRIWR